MNFKDLLDKYKAGSASSEEAKLVEEELNKHEAIQDYLSENYNLDFEKDILEESTTKETTFVKKSVNKKLRKVILASVSIVFLIIFIIFCVISPIINNLYYDPSKKTVGKEQQDLYFDLKVITELNYPGYLLTGPTTTENLGFGTHNIYFQRRNLFTNEIKEISTKIKRNNKIGLSQDFFPGDYSGFTTLKFSSQSKGQSAERVRDRLLNNIKELNPISYISAYIIFEKDLSMNEFYELSRKYEDKIAFKWVAVRTGSETVRGGYKGQPAPSMSGFNPNEIGGSFSDDRADENKYPYLQMSDWMTDGKTIKSDFAEYYTKHFTSLLKYMADREKAVTALDHNDSKFQYYKDSLKYIEENGVKTYGVLVYAEAKDLLEFINNENLKFIQIDNVIPFKKTP
ncbi:Sigma factor regulator C-terminal [Clostridium amylolyticum]|uniref:Sigma factor regulator C-terminal n=1 Tax=Clostridium amylolyticum TaxID=1121298 RepID=A0A1M6I298_9CLOT|nr:anti sigma factor C-terminal domain-containing protein [Clostridium amylolyticum]SHJ28586.1 Sigma factor regulator C-terminal [Clostridium amylolyticum]